MVFTRSVVVGSRLPCWPPCRRRRRSELSVSQRLQDRREVAAGTRAQVLGFEDGRFYANGWHITGEMGGVVTPPLKLLDSLSFGVEGSGSARPPSSRAGRATPATPCPRSTGCGSAHRRRPRRPARRPDRPQADATRRGTTKTVKVKVDAHSELMTQYPWGFSGTVPNASDNAQDRGEYDGRRLVFRDTGGSRASREPLLHGARRLRPRPGRRHDGPRPLRPVRPGPALRRRPDASADAERSATTAPSAAAPAGSCATS